MTQQQTEETRLLTARSAEFEQAILPITDSIYTAVGFSVSTVSLIIGAEGVIIIDTGLDQKSAEKVLAAFRTITDKPIRAIILTHGHPDHIGGLPVFLADSAAAVQIWARDNFGHEITALKEVGITAQRTRGRRQSGFALPPEKRINNGIAQAYYPDFKLHGIRPNQHLTAPRQTLQIEGVTIELVATTGETYDHLYAWLPEQGVLFSGDNIYKSWPNLYPLRGAPYRDIPQWMASLERMKAEGATHLVMGHTRPISGKNAVETALTTYHAAIKSIFDQTIEGINRGLTPDQLVEVVKLPEQFADNDLLRPYYGHPAWAVRSIFAGYLGWFDGNPTTLFPLNPVAEATRMADLAGGASALLCKAEAAIETKDYQWAAQLCDYLLALEEGAIRPKQIKATALEGLAEGILSGIGRNYYLTSAQELRQSTDPTPDNPVKSIW